MYVGDIREFEANQLERAAISTPAVADITSAENDSIIVSAKDSGYTKLNWKDINGDHTVRIHVILEDISLFKSSIDELLKSIDGLDIIY
ncbi:MAG: pilus assembly protein N-terminal domain-containing protein [Candidatus Omnitrophica bacterium]|nr:pilus assembly protein N-terminal domain-containing protein [Candidatus Omnitrophota bacterium]